MMLLSLCGPRCAPPTRAEVRDARKVGDPTNTSNLRTRMRNDADRRWRVLGQTLRQALIDQDLLGMRGVGRMPYGDKTEGFAMWLREELRQKVFGQDGSWVKPYLYEAAMIAQMHADRYAPGGNVDQLRVATMQSLAQIELRGIVETAQQQITRTVTNSMMVNSPPTRMANALSGVIQTMRNRTRAMSEHSIAKTHATATLSAYRDAGVSLVGTIPEHVRNPARGVRDADVGKPISVSVNRLVREARARWRERLAALTRRFGRERAAERLAAEMTREAAQLEQATTRFGERMAAETTAYVAKRHAEGEALRAATETVREEIRAMLQARVGILPTRAAVAVEGPGALTRAETPSPRTIQRIERVQRRLQRALGGGLVEVITAGDDYVCQVCQDISEEGPYTLPEAESLIPAHPWCRCAFVPAGTYEKDGSRNKKTKIIADQHHGVSQGLEDAEAEGQGDWHAADEALEVEVEAPTDAEVRDDEKGHPFRGNQWTGGIAGAGRAYEGKTTATRHKLTKTEQDRIGEKIAVDFLKRGGLKDARTLNVTGNNFPLDLAGDHMLIELKTGLSSVGYSAQQWRITFSTSASEREKLSRMSPERRSSWYARKQKEAFDRKLDAHKEIEKEVGRKLKPVTLGVILNHDKGVADIYAFNGYHQRIGWNQEATKKAYVKTVKYR